MIVNLSGIIFPLSHRCLIEIKGPDTVQFLQGLLTQDVQKASENHLLYSLMLTPQGRFSFDFFVCKKDDGSFWLEVEKERMDELSKVWQRYRLRSQVEWETLDHLVYGSSSALQGAFEDPRNSSFGYRFYSPKPVEKVSDAHTYHQYRIPLGIPEAGYDLIPGKTIPLEAHMDVLHAISWDKGCYIGQELTARTHYQGLVRKKLFPVELAFSISKEGPLSLTNQEGEEVGTLYSRSGHHGIALLRLSAIENPFYTEGVEGKAVVPIWMVK